MLVFEIYLSLLFLFSDYSRLRAGKYKKETFNIKHASTSKEKALSFTHVILIKDEPAL
jgi:hypothetical protein